MSKRESIRVAVYLKAQLIKGTSDFTLNTLLITKQDPFMGRDEKGCLLSTKKRQPSTSTTVVNRRKVQDGGRRPVEKCSLQFSIWSMSTTAFGSIDHRPSTLTRLHFSSLSTSVEVSMPFSSRQVQDLNTL